MDLAGLKLVRREPIEDVRGSFTRLFCSEVFREAGFGASLSQVNHTHTALAGTIRGLHFQRPPHAEVKVVTCLRGRILDVAVDLRRGSPTFLRWQGFHLSADEPLSLLIPEGFAHGFQTLTADCELLYFHSAPYLPEASGGLHPLDPALAINWPLEVGVLSERDRSHPMIGTAFEGLCP
jgi:dTDP-4-dehydrorhamnose 3,5-epimerase